MISLHVHSRTQTPTRIYIFKNCHSFVKLGKDKI